MQRHPAAWVDSGSYDAWRLCLCAVPLDQSEDSEPTVGVVWFDFVSVGSEGCGTKSPLFDFAVGWDRVPAFEGVFGGFWDPVAHEGEAFAVDRARGWVRVFVFEGVEFRRVVDVCLELVVGFLFGEGDVTGEFFSDLSGVGMKHEIRVVTMIETMTMM